MAFGLEKDSPHVIVDLRQLRRLCINLLELFLGSLEGGERKVTDRKLEASIEVVRKVGEIDVVRLR